VVNGAGRTAFVTGGSGFIGGKLIKRLVGEGWRVRALARSDAAEQKVSALGAEPVRGDLEDRDALRAGAAGAELAFHAAAHLGEWGDRAEFERINVGGTHNAIDAARAAGVRRFVHVGTEAGLLAGEPLVNVNEDAPLRPDSKAAYSATKAMAEQTVRAANGEGFETVVVRPRLVWGAGDTKILPALVEAVEKKRFSWIGGGTHRTSTTHVDNVIQGLMLGAERGRPGGVYFVTDGEPVIFREFITELLGTQGVTPPDRNTPAPVGRAAAAASEGIWRLLRRPGNPPVTRLAYWLSAQECTIDIARARQELGYEPARTIPEGMEELRREQSAGSRT
jgi:nucleoside-diphosphate-sugar epimerase